MGSPGKTKINTTKFWQDAVEQAKAISRAVAHLPEGSVREEVQKALAVLGSKLNAVQEHVLAEAQRYEYVLDGAGLGSWDWWLETNDVNFDRRWCEMLGLRLEQTPQHFSTWDSRVHPEDKAKAYQDIKNYLEGKTSIYENIHRMMHADGHWVWILSRGRIGESDVNGKAVRFTGTHFDVTAFKEQQSLSEEIQKIAKIGAWELDAATGKTRWTAETYRIHAVPEGTPTDKIMGINFYAPHERKRIAHYVGECLQGKPYQDVFEFIDAEGQQKWVEAMGKPVVDAAGHVCKLIGTFQDVSERKASLEKIKSLAENNAKYRLWIENANEGIWEIDAKGITLFANPTMARLLKYDARSMIGRHFFDFMAKDDQDLAAAKLAQRSSGAAETHEWRFLDATGSEIWLNVSAVPFLDTSGVLTSIVAFCSDITKLKEREADLRQSHKAISTLSSQLDDYFSASLDLICIANTDGYFKRINPSFTRILGYSEDELLSREFLSFIHPDDIAETMKIVESLAAGQPLLNFENRYRCKSGAYRIISWHCQPNTVTGDLYAAGRDITEQKATEASLKNLTLALNQSAIVAFTDDKGRITEVNDNFCKISGYSRKELIGKTHQLINSGEHPPDFFATMWKTISSGRTWTGDIKNRRKDGAYYWVKTVISPVQNLENKNSRYVAIRIDITQQKTMEILNQKIAHDLREAQSIAKIGSWSFDLLTNNLTWSSEHYRIFEIQEPQNKEDLYLLYRSRIYKDDLEILDALVEHAVRSGESFVYDHRLLSSNGTIKYVQGIGKVTKNAEGIPVRISGTCQDISERVQREQELRFILDGLGIGIWKWDLKTNALEWDENMYRLYGAERRDFNGAYEAWEKSLSPATKAKAVEEINAAIKGESEFDTTFQVLHKSGKIQEIRTKAFIIRDENGTPLKMHGINVDRSREAELERSVDQERIKAVRTAKLASLGEMSAGIAHEINNPLAIIVGSAQLLPKFMQNPEKLTNSIETIQKAASRITKVVRSLKKFSRSSEKSERALHSLKKIVDEAVTLTEAKAKRHSTVVEVVIDSDGYILCDEIEIEQVLVNLIHNGIDAIKSLKEKWVQIRVCKTSEQITLQVRDSGTGIEKDIEAKLFQPFFTTKAVGEGTGLGLSIVKGILDEHNATIELVQTDKHTCFEMKFPKIGKEKHAA